MRYKLSKKARELIREYTKDLSKIDKARDRVEPYYMWEIDGVVNDIIKAKVTPRQFKYFEACKFKMKGLWYIKDKMEEWDEKTAKFVNLCIKEKTFDYFIKINSEETTLNEAYSYFPFFVALEFENLLMQGKACLDAFSKAIGCVFGESPGNIDKLIKVLEGKQRRDQRAGKVLKIIKQSRYLKGVVLDPKRKGKKSVRDLVTHREQAPVFFRISKAKNGKYTTSKGALLQMRHPELILLSNHLVGNIAGNVWYDVLAVMVNSFKVVFDIKEIYPKYQ